MLKLGFGTMRLPILNDQQSEIDLPLFTKMVDTFMERGFTYFDTAYFYHGGQSEVALKKALIERYPRSSYTLCDKLPIRLLKTKEDNQRIFDEQMERLGVDYLDYYWLHAVNMDRYNNCLPLGTIDFVKSLKEKGIVKHLGFSYHDSAENLRKILKDNNDWVEYVQLQLNYLDWNSTNIESRKCYEVCKEFHKPVIVMEPIKGGALANLSANSRTLLDNFDKEASSSSFAIRFAASLDNVYMVLSGMSNYEQLLDNTSYMQDFQPLSDEEKDVLLNKIVKNIETEIKISCTACRYCETNCPAGVKIPEIFRVINNPYHRLADYLEVTKDGGKAGECLKCGVCEGACPQNLPIRELLADAAKEFHG